MRCFNCGAAIEIATRPGRGDECPSCGSDVKVCLNCRFHDPSSHNECRETQAEMVAVKDRSNYCEYFEPGEGGPAEKEKAEDPLGKLKDLFK